VNEYLGMLLDGDLSKWELRLYAGAGSLALYLLKLGFDRFIHKWDASKKVQHRDHVRLWQHDDEIVESVRAGKPFPEIPPEENGGGQ
jgi:hypothetical protein